jgi:ADP-ribosyl-[dinitrogen reductase] hydrolase
VPESDIDPISSADPHVMQRAIGALVGAAVADALGAPYEFGPAGRYSAEFTEPVLGGTGEMRGGGSFGWAPGEFTDDTQMALALAGSILASGGFDPDDLWARFRAWAGHASDVGIATRASLAHADWRGAAEAGHHSTGGRSASNGALMRVTPLALAWSGAPTDELMRVVVQHAALTHHDPAAGWGAAIQAELVRRAILGADPIDEIDDVVALVPESQRDTFVEVLAPGWAPDRPGPRNGSVWTCLAQAVWANRHGSSFADVVTRAIDLGGDTDTVATVAGALAGARFGPAGVPSRWSTYVHGSVDLPGGERARFDLAELQATAVRLMGRTPVGLAPLEPAAGPGELAPGLHAANLTSAAGVPTDWAVVSLCRTGGMLDGRAVRREVYLTDSTTNLDPVAAVRDAVDSIDAFLAEGRQVALHCHAGQSRTGLVAKAWAMRRHGMSEREAHTWLAERWPHYTDREPSFRTLLTDHFT